MGMLRCVFCKVGKHMSRNRPFPELPRCVTLPEVSGSTFRPR